LPGVVIDLLGVEWLLTCTWDSSSEFLLPTNNFGSVGVLALLALFICLSILRWYICRDDENLAIYGHELFSRIVRGDSCAGDLKREAVQGCFSIQLAAMGRS
jgi:hypothetical protein